MKLSHEKTKDGLTLVHCAGRLTLVELQHVHDPLVKQLGRQVYRTRVLLDLSQVEYLDSSGIGWLVVSYKRFRQAKGTIVFHSPSPFVKQLLDMMRLDLVLPVVADEEAARARALQE